MLQTQLNLANTNHLVATGLVVLLLTKSVSDWIKLWRSQGSGQSLFPRSEEPRANWVHFPELMAVVLVLTMLALNVGLKLVSKPTSSPEPFTFDNVVFLVVYTGGVALVLGGFLSTGQQPPAEYGLKWKGLLQQVRDGVTGYFLSLGPTAVLLLLTSPLRNRDNQNALLTLLSDCHDPITVILICMAAIVMAPLSEEMMFRVILQGWLTSLIKPRLAITITALTFAAIHGPVDGMALVPLAGILGYVFDRRHSYVSVLVIHGLFNATMLTLALLTQV